MLLCACDSLGSPLTPRVDLESLGYPSDPWQLCKISHFTECLSRDFQKISQKQISEKIPKYLKEIYELVIDFKSSGIGKISMHIIPIPINQFRYSGYRYW